MLKKLHISLIFSTLAVSNPLSTIIIDMHNFVAKFGKILEICKKFAGNRVNEKGNIPRRGVVPTFSDIEVVALSITAEAFSIDSENYLFNRLNTECPGAIANLITRRQFNQRRKLTRDILYSLWSVQSQKLFKLFVRPSACKTPPRTNEQLNSLSVE